MIKIYPQTIYCLIIASGLIICAAGCKKHTDHTGSNGGNEVNVYVLGSVGDSVAYWKNGLLHDVYSQASMINRTGTPSIFASGNDVYIPGIKPNINSTIHGTVPLYWQNDTPVVLPDSAGNATANCIFISNNDVYVAGVTSYWSADTSHVLYTTPSGIYPKSGNVATLWKNGVGQTLSGFHSVGLVGTQYAVSTYADYISSIFVTGNDVYVAGGSYYSGNNAMYWKNGVATNITNTLTYTVNGTVCFPTTTSISVSGNDVYIAGVQWTSALQDAAVYWKNGVASFLTDSSGGASANAISVSGNNVYIAGYQNINNYSRAILWKNGVPTTLTQGAVASVATSVYVNGSDVYVAGYEWQIGGRYIAVYWKNGEEVKLSDGITPAIARSIYVQ